ncbi:MAG TPA: Fic family protein [Fluviicola sp.]|nr:Fic family protein [Fluviicola sp.]
MATPGEKLAASLEELKKLQDADIVAIKSSALSRVHRERLIENGFIKEVAKGWYLSVPNDEQDGDSTSWYASYWSFCSEYLNDRFGNTYCISAEQSLQIHAGNNTVPTQLIIRSVNGPNGLTELPFNTSLFTMRSPLHNNAEIEVINGIRMLTLPSALIHCSPVMFTNNATDVRTALTMVRDSSEVLGLLLDGGHSTIAGRLAGAFRNIGEEKIANDIIKSMRAAGYDVRETDPFETPTPILLSSREKSPYVNKIKLMWHEMRDVILGIFPDAPGIPEDHAKYMKAVEDLYVTDAYHSLSIEKYRVTPELIERVRSGTWDIDKNPEDKKQKDAMAARGYWQASQVVRKSIEKILQGKNPGKVADSDHSDWYLELFGPSVTSGILKPSDLAGYRNAQVYIRGSKHVPLNVDAVRDAMPVFFELLQAETHPGVRAVLGHFIFVFIHPYMDGNGRMGRFLMNTMLASGGYPWTVIPVEERDTYMKALEKASVEMKIDDFANYIAYLVNEGLKGTPVAKLNT